MRVSIMSRKKQKKKVLYQVQCIHNENHLFEKVFEIEAGSEEKEETEVETYCPYCNKLVTVVVKGKVPLDKPFYRHI
jgi:ribosomal protein L44E